MKKEPRAVPGGPDSRRPSARVPQYSLGKESTHDPRQLRDARASYTQAAHSGNVDAQVSLGLLLVGLDPAELSEARTWLTKAPRPGTPAASTTSGCC